MTFPFESGVYSVGPGLRPLTGPATCVQGLERYRAEKARAAAGRAVCLERDLPAATREAALRVLRHLLESEHPDVYVPGLLPHSLEQLPFLIAEDVAIMQLDEERESLAFGHICLPSSWRLEDKIGRPFLEVHQPVPGFPAAGAAKMVRTLATKGPYERYAWGLTNADVLDQPAGAHPEVQPAPLWVRVERQTLHPLPGCDAWLFLIHPTNTPVHQLTAPQRAQLASALESMTPEQATYKGLATTRDAVCAALTPPARRSG
jgi:hypothetical protein